MMKRRGGVGVRRNTVLTMVEQIRSLKANLRSLKVRCASQQRTINRLLAESPQLEAEKEIARLEERCEDLTRCWEDSEREILHLRRQLLQEIA